MVKQSDPQTQEYASHILTEAWLSYCSIGVLYKIRSHTELWVTAMIHMPQCLLFSDGLISMKFNLPAKSNWSRCALLC